MKTFLLFVVIVSVSSTNFFSQTAIPPSTGDGTSGSPYQITSLENLYWITLNAAQWNKYFVQTANIDASSTASWDSTGWLPISSFDGNYDGGNFIISNLYINRPASNYIGLFGQVTAGASVKKLGVINVNVTGHYYVGGLVGLNTGTVENCFVSGNVTGSYAWIGGLIGGNNFSGVTNACYSHANANGGECVGSLTGENFNGGTINNSYATGNAAGTNVVGGLSGTNYLGTIINSYSVGLSSQNGLIGAGGGTCTNSFWDTTSSGQASSEGGLGLSTEELKTLSTFTDAGWDFNTIWEIIGTNYPRLQAIPDSSLAVGVEHINYHPEQFMLKQNYPNPFNPATKIKYSIAKEGLVAIKVYNVIGQEVATLVNETKQAGNHEVTFNSNNLTSGVYLYKMTSGGFTQTKKMILMK